MPPAEKYLKKLNDKPLKKLYQDAIKEIQTNPDVGQQKIGDLAGIYGYDIRYQKTSYEIAYYLTENDQGEVVVVIMAGTRENFWDAVKSYMN
ncbi:type II toxin-antitoxin system RelE/ParE family toxin [Brevibacillus invocatus]|uniref:Type II toxin-antitoxin system RelE/ParE family toxin n=1 Tax=Brevibacillus invocatus TaxID=173959 RepID=A0A3M8BNL4_9BACL|nr:type II toxin-antitoxin system RelE/ParE family toxin [Brevibacillus invocatus]RNB65009.1 type II toxin-antitoxin system RelE/ParE family toxin [Brevibacillus invocatus]